MNFKERILICAIKDGAVETLNEIFNFLLGDFIEGEDDFAGDLFNKYFPMVSNVVKQKVIDTTPFERTANRLAKKNNLRPAWRETDPQFAWKWEYMGLERNPHFGYKNPSL